MYEIEFTETALKDLVVFRKFEQQSIIDGIESQLMYVPNVATRHRKKLRPNKVANWEFRLGKFRVFYNVDVEQRKVSIEAVGFKAGNMLFIRGKQRSL
ncbi:type II toxin-antitoxin system RelE/ParE family toxin [candidate division KSB1 bacterium]|nr:type II toxin-antitoxin system RelE/ParE family toxin [candidate division KSB1 bacterium]